MTNVVEFGIAIVLLLAVIPHAVAFFILLRATDRGEAIAALDERRVAATWWLVSSGIIGLLVLNVLFGRPVGVQPPWAQLITGFALLAGAVPAFLFCLRYFRHGFEDEDN